MAQALEKRMDCSDQVVKRKRDCPQQCVIFNNGAFYICPDLHILRA